MKHLTKKEKELWNEAVRETLRELKKYDGTIPSKFDREYLASEIYQTVAYKDPDN